MFLVLPIAFYDGLIFPPGVFFHMMKYVYPCQQEVKNELLEVWKNDYLDQVQLFQTNVMIQVLQIILLAVISAK